MKPLRGVRVADFSWAIAGPYGTMMLAMMGAEVIKVENRQRIDLIRKLSSVLGWEDQPDPERSFQFNLINLNKRGLTLDLSRPKAVELAKKLVSISDVVVENFSPGVMDRLGLEYETLRQVKPDIIMLSVSAAGATGPERRALGYAPIFHSVSGMGYLTGYPDSPPGYIRAPIDCNVASMGALAVMSALVQRQRTGQGQYIDLSAREAISHLIGHVFTQAVLTGKEPQREGNYQEEMAPHDCYPCRGDDRWVSIAVGSDEEWQALVWAMGSPAWAGEQRFGSSTARLLHREELDRRIGEWTRDRDPYEVTSVLQGAGVAAFPSLSGKDVSTDPHLKAREGQVEVEHPTLGEQVVFGPPWKFSQTPPQVNSPAPLLGQHNEYVLKDLLNLSSQEIADLESTGVLS
jgi:benzylsuccinate CoA-transferase BbsF subunit